MKKLIFALVFVLSAASFAGYSGGGGTVSEADLATKLGTNDLANTLSGDEPDKVPSVAAVNDGLAGKLNVTNGIAYGIFSQTGNSGTVRLSSYYTNSVAGVGTNGVWVKKFVTENGTTNTYYSLYQ